MKGDWIICYECNKVFDTQYERSKVINTQAEGIREDYIDVCSMDTAEVGWEIGYYCPHCGCLVIRCYADEISLEDWMRLTGR